MMNNEKLSKLFKEILETEFDPAFLSKVIQNRVAFMYLVDCRYSNPNGDPDADNAPRTDLETFIGLLSSESQKRKIREFIDMLLEGQHGFKDSIKKGVTLESNMKQALRSLGVDPDDHKAIMAARKNDPEFDAKALAYMCENFYDIRAFGGVMANFAKHNMLCSQITGTVQLGVGRSVEPIHPEEMTLTRSTVSTEKEAETKQNMFGSKYIVPYGLYCVTGHINPYIASKVTGYTEADKELLWQAILHMNEFTRSSCRDLATRKLFIWTHEKPIFGNCPDFKLFDTVKITRKNSDGPARCFEDYDITVDYDAIPEGVTLEIREP